MSNSVFREANTQSETVEAPVTPAPAEGGSSITPKVSVPHLFTSYEEDQGKPYTAEYFELETAWKQPELKRDVLEIDGYLKELVSKGKIDNTTKAIDAFVKEMERKAGLSRYESTNNRISKILAYIDFQRVVHG